jgi:hypothetical protein
MLVVRGKRRVVMTFSRNFGFESADVGGMDRAITRTRSTTV